MLKFITHGNRFDKDSYKETLQYLTKLKDVKKCYEDDVDVEDIKIDFSSFSNRTHYKDLVNGNVRRYYEQLEWTE